MTIWNRDRYNTNSKTVCNCTHIFTTNCKQQLTPRSPTKMMLMYKIYVGVIFETLFKLNAHHQNVWWRFWWYVDSSVLLLRFNVDSWTTYDIFWTNCKSNRTILDFNLLCCLVKKHNMTRYFDLTVLRQTTCGWQNFTHYYHLISSSKL